VLLLLLALDFIFPGFVGSFAFLSQKLVFYHNLKG